MKVANLSAIRSMLAGKLPVAEVDDNEAQVTVPVRLYNSDGKTLVSGLSPLYMQLYGSVLEEPKDNNNANEDGIITFSENILAVEIYHEEDTWQSFTVNGLTFKVPAGGYRSLVGGTPGKTVAIPNINCLVGRLI